MARLRVLPIVEGHGEDAAIRILLERIGSELPGCEHIEVLRPLRWPKTKLLQELELKRAVELACLKLAPLHSPEHPLVLILLDADEDPPCRLGPELLANARQVRPDVDIVCVLAKVEYETWFVAAAESLAKHGYLRLAAGESPPDRPELTRSGEAWIRKHLAGARYSKTVDQPAFTRHMDLASCRQRAPSFAKLCRDLEAATVRAAARTANASPSPTDPRRP